jgi:hypothetical protein
MSSNNRNRRSVGVGVLGAAAAALIGAGVASADTDLDPFQDLFGDTGFNSWTPSADGFLASIDPTLAANFDTSVDNFDSSLLTGGTGQWGAFEFLASVFDQGSGSWDPTLDVWLPNDAIGDLATGLDYILGPTLDGDLYTSLLLSSDLPILPILLLFPFG